MNSHDVTIPERRSKLPLRTEAILAGIGLGGALLAAAALWWPSGEPPAPVIAPVAIVDSPRPFVGPPAPVAPEAVEVIEAKPPEVPLATEDREADYESIAKDAIENGDLTLAFAALRKQLYTAGPTSQLLFRIGRIGAQLKEHAIAVEALKQAGELDKTDAQIRVELGRVLLEVGDREGAESAARAAIKIDRDLASAWNLSGRVAMAESHWDRAEIALRQAVQLDPTDAMLNNNLGLLYVYMHQGKNAVDSLQASVELYGDDVPFFVFNNLGLAHELNGQLEDARDAFEQALVANPEYARARVNLRRVLTTIANHDQLQAMKARTAQIDPDEQPEMEGDAADQIPDGLSAEDDDLEE